MVRSNNIWGQKGIGIGNGKGLETEKNLSGRLALIPERITVPESSFRPMIGFVFCWCDGRWAGWGGAGR